MLKNKVNGIELAYERCGSGTPLVLIHGYPLDHTIWDAVVPLLGPGFDLILPDLRGFGESGAPLTQSSMDDFAADLAGLLDQLGIQKAAIVGHSMGGYVAFAFARSYAGRLLGLGLVASQANPDTPEKKAGRTKEAEDILAHGVGDVAEGMSLKLTENRDLRARLKELILRQRPAGLSGALRAMAGRQDSRLQFSSLNLPVVLVHGLADKLIPVDRAREVRDGVKNAHLTEIEGAGHMPMMEVPQVTAQALKALL